MQRKLLVVTDTIPPDPNGVALIAVHTATLLGATGSVHLFGPAGLQLPWPVRQTTVPRSRFGTPDLRLSFAGGRALAAAVRESAEVVVHSLGPLGCMALALARWYGRPATLFVHSELSQLLAHGLAPTPRNAWIANTSKHLEQWALDHATRVVAPGSLAQAGHDVLQLAPPRHKSPRGRHPRDRDRLLTVAYHGRISREKAVDATVRAVARADPRHDRLRVRLVGAGSDLEPTIALAQSLQVPIEHLGWCGAPLEHLANADIYVMASRTETYSMSTLEALGCGLPVVARRVGEIPYYVVDGENGLLFDDDSELAPLLSRLATDSRLRRRLAEGARESATDRSIWQQFATASVSA